MHLYRVAYSYTSNVTGKTEISVRKVVSPYSTLHQKARDAIAEMLRQSHFGPTVEGDGVVVLSACRGLSSTVKEQEWYAPVVNEPTPDSPVTEIEEQEPVKEVKHKKASTKKKSTTKKKSKASGW